ncbi:SPOR domain-containing protein [Paremcibacter congregatus]|uniref:SPOR domain-containing protein n=1 Tax=Paremcibacter congregatus TaxID=2043170 RepID=UPI0030ED31A5|tara:strand:+ start:5270 stop:6049 length:780 start_codon:yes stop_codon:yes gene_type:complete
MSDESGKSSWLEPLPEEYTADGDMTGRRMLVAALTVVVLAIFGGIVWYSYVDGAHTGPVPIVRADNSVVKEKPDNPGGLNVPDQDKRVFVRVDSEEPSYAEELAPSAEVPVNRPMKKEDTTKTDEMDIPKTSPVAEPQTSEPGQEAAQKQKIQEPDVPDVKTTQKAAAIAPSSRGAAGDFLVQLGAFSKKSTAEGLWTRLQKENASVLAGLASDIVMVDLGKKGVLYRLRGGMLVDRAAAEKVCTVLKSRKQACIVVSN